MQYRFHKSDIARCPYIVTIYFHEIVQLSEKIKSSCPYIVTIYFHEIVQLSEKINVNIGFGAIQVLLFVWTPFPCKSLSLL